MLPKILVVEDNMLVRRALCRMLAGMYEVSEAQGGRDAFELYSLETFELILTDLAMPDGDGLELIERIRQQDRSIPIVAISGGGPLGSAASALQLAEQKGADVTLAKPVRPADLQDVVKKLLEQR